MSHKKNLLWVREAVGGKGEIDWAGQQAARGFPLVAVPSETCLCVTRGTRAYHRAFSPVTTALRFFDKNRS